MRLPKPPVPLFYDDPPPEEFPPEKRLLIAMVQRALIDYIAPEKGKTHLQYDAGAWLFAAASKEPFSLYWVCEVLSSDTEYAATLHKRIQIAARTKAYRPKCVMIRVDSR